MIKTYEASGKTVEEAIDAALILANTTLDNVDVEVLDLGSKGVFGFGRKDVRVRISLEVAEKPAPKPAPKAKEQRPPRERSERPERTSRETRPEAAKPAPEKTKEEREERPAREGGERGPGNQNSHRNRNTSGGKSKSGNSRPAAEERPRAPRIEGDRSPKITAGPEAEALAQEALTFLKPIFAKLNVQPKMEQEIKDGILWLTFTGHGLGSLIGRRGETLNALQYLTNLAVNRERKEHYRLVLDVEGYRAGREETLVTLAKKMADKAIRTGRRVELDPMNPHERRIVHIALQNDRRVDTTSHGEEPYRRVVINRRRNYNDRRRPGGGAGGQHQHHQEQPERQEQPQHSASASQAPLSLSQQLAQQFDQQLEKRR